MKEIRLLEDRNLKSKINRYSAVSIILFAIVFFGIARTASTPDMNDSTVFNIIFAILILFGTLIIHELIHGLFFKAFSHKNKVYFGFKNGMPYAASPSSIFTRFTFAISCIAPFIIITALYIGSLYLGLLPKLIFVMVSTIHAAICSGDFYWVYEMGRAPKDAEVKATNVGIKILRS
ncbi:DUF3267 domain-containing protein [Barrientosiimonas marina]|uniref:DUF3267 domain-containing protein n=1 Tax=Lentibacillus kimchii TaxID=1542911 RepID=A0ABW2UTS4_9BACI